MCLGAQSHSMDCIVHQAPLSMRFPMQEYWSGLTVPSRRDLPNPGTKLASPALQANSLPLSLSREVLY